MMKTYQLKFLAWTFSAFLPPDDNNSEEKVDYYQLLDVPHNANADDIKKAYRKRSLQLHPDKLKQRGMKYQGQVITEEEARSRFQEMKQAYDTLSDPKKRQIYDALGQKGIDFVNNPSHAYDPHVLMNNLANSSVFDRAKLMMLVLIFFGLVLLQPILICAKVDQMLAESGSLQDSSWVAILVPFWLFAVFYIVLLVIGKAVVPLVTWIVFVIGILFLTLKFDNTITWKYGAVFIPFYLWMVLRLYEANSDIRSIRADMSKMVTIEYIEKYVINEVQQDEEGNDIEEGQNLHRAYNDLNEEERDEINKDYIIVHVPPKPQPPPGLETDDEEEDEFERIERSLEYQEAETRRAFASKSMQRIFLPELPLLILIIVQLDYNKSWNWGLTFLPLWIALVFECCGGCYGFFCTSALAHIEVQEQMEAHISKEMEKKEEEAKGEEEQKDIETNEDVEEEAKPENNEEKAGIDTAVSVEPPTKTDTPKSESEAANTKEAEQPKTEAVESPSTDLPDVSSMKISELKEELELYGVDASAFVEKSEFTAALQNARDTLPRPTAAAKVESPVQEADKDGDTDDDDDDDDAYMFEMDEDMFHHFKQAEVEAENKASEAQSKAIGSFCNIIFQAIIASVFVAKLNQVYEERDKVPPMDGTTSFSSFWIIFPFLLISGCIICCFGCAIFGASNIDTAMKSDDASENGEENGAEEGAATSNDDPVILTPPQPMPMAQEEVVEDPPEQKDETNYAEPESSNDVEKGETGSAPTETEDMDDLD